MARLVGGEPKLVTFTSGGTEANVTVLTPEWTRGGKPFRADVLFVGATEHPSVLAGGRFPADRVHLLPVNGDGVIDLPALGAALAPIAARGERALVSVMLANNETGVIQPVAEMARIAHEAGAIVHTDAIQAAGRIPVDIAALGVDVLTLSAHKIGGPQGAGAIVRASEDLAFAPLLTGGGQEKRSRAGTENVAAIAGFGAAAKAALADLDKATVWAGWRDELAGILGASGRELTVFGARRGASAADPVRRDRGNSGRNAGDRARPRRGRRLLRLRLLVGQGGAEPCAFRNGGTRSGRKRGNSLKPGVGIGER